MRVQYRSIGPWALCLIAAFVACALLEAGCASGGLSYSQMVLGHGIFSNYTGSTPEPQSGGSGGFFDSGGRSNIDPCEETTSRKYIRISMRSLVTDSYVHYFLVLVAYVNGETYPNGAVCADDVKLYTDFGYTEIAAGAQQAFGNYCIRGPALLYFHKSGQFRSGGSGAGNSSLGSALGPAQGTSATYDNFFTSSGARVPVPNQIIFHNPGSGEGAALKVNPNSVGPCDIVVGDFGVSDCAQDAFYYVDESDLMTGSTATGVGSGLRVPSEIQGTGCQCSGFEDPYQTLAPSGTSASAAHCSEFLRGGRIEYVFFREDTNPPFPQLIWRVTDQNGATVHDFASNAPKP
jgi:hypothetical protein